jgi:nucleotide-binding universal stress UspA family protein
MVPTNGSVAARSAAELAFLLAREQDEVMAVNIIQTQDEPYRAGFGRGVTERDTETAQAVVANLCTLGEAQGVRTRAMVRQGRDAETVILDLARSAGVGLIVLGTSVRAGSDRLFLGPRVERIIAQAPCPVLVYNGP